MKPCPHCGTENSENKHICYHCQLEITPRPEPETPVNKRLLRPRMLPQPQVPQRELTAGEVITPKPVPVPAEAPKPKQRAKASAFWGATLAQRAQFYRQMQSLLKSGIPIGLALGYLEQNIAFNLRPLVRDITQHVQGGGQLSEAMARYPNIFPDWEVSLVVAAEKGGTMPEAMRDVADTLEMEMQLRHEVNGKTLHLKFTAGMAVLVMLILGGVHFSIIAGGMSGVLARLQTVAIEFLLILAAGFGLVMGWRSAMRTRQGARFGYGFSSRIPLLGPIIKNMMRIRFVRVLGALWHAGVAPVQALEMAAHASGNQHVINQVDGVLASISQGATLSDALAPTHVLPPEAMYLLQSGEMSGSVPEALNNVAEYIRMDLESQVKTLPAKAQMIMYLILGPLIGWIVISFYVGYFTQIFNSVP
ncbi:MAG TPA: type II secretion system F family protein, partial [Armatimonadota bacterium]|jgi:type II secretory pathway component PulF